MWTFERSSLSSFPAVVLFLTRAKTVFSEELLNWLTNSNYGIKIRLKDYLKRKTPDTNVRISPQCRELSQSPRMMAYFKR